MIDPILAQVESLLGRDLEAAQKMRWLFRLAPWSRGDKPMAPPRWRAAR